ncbi:MAG: hypothetical protein ACK5M3_08230 [Dysgonomonas sp.]
MKKNIIILSIFLLLGLQLRAQFTISYSSGYGKYDMGDMKDALELFKSSMKEQLGGLDIRTVDNFPGYITHTLEVGHKVGKSEFGLKSSFYTTGGKLSYADYSGGYEQKITMRGFREGIYFRYHFYTTEIGYQSAFSIYGELSPSLLVSQMKHSLSIGITDEGEDKLNNKSTKVGVAIMPLVGVKYSITPKIGVHLSAGYDFDLTTPKTKIDLQSAILETKSDWSGIRAFAGVSYSF